MENYIASTATKTLSHHLFKDHMKAAVTLHDGVGSGNQIGSEAVMPTCKSELITD